ncbi:MAG: RNA polymerase sigma-70 factor [Bacteroidota bacterium]
MEGAPNISDPLLFRSLFTQYLGAIRNFIYYKCGDLQLAEDIAQESFIRLWQHADKVPEVKAKSFLYRVANNLYLDQVKHQKVVLKFQQRPSKQQDSEDPAFHLEVQEYQAFIERVISELPEKSRVVFLMNRMEGLTYQEISDRLEISVKAVEKRMHKALIIIKKHKLPI